jgi:hypothetical protein
MSGKLVHGRGDEDDEVDYRRRNESSSSTTSKKVRSNEDKIEKKELISEISINSNIHFNKKEKKFGSKELDDLYSSYLPSSDYYERSYMHRDILTHIIVTITDFLITASQDGHIKFWKILTPDYIKQQQTATQYQSNQTKDDNDANTNSLINGPIEFVKHFRAHLGKLLVLFKKSES